MDIPAQWAMRYLEDLLPPSSIEFLQSYILHPDSPFQSIRRTLTASLAGLYPIVALFVERITTAFFNSPDIVVIGSILVLLLLAIQILNWTRRVVISLTRLVFNLIFYAAVVAVVAWMYQRGLEASVRDAFVYGGRVYGYAVGIKDVFLREYERYVEEERRNTMRTGGAGGRGAAGARAGYTGWR
ncbi:hypothetical protein V8F20_009797 [Naviculisporaceae sp. PSN 640]